MMVKARGVILCSVIAGFMEFSMGTSYVFRLDSEQGNTIFKLFWLKFLFLVVLNSLHMQ